MLDLLQLRVNLDEFEQLRLCQAVERSDCHAAFTVQGTKVIWPTAHWSDTPTEEKINIRGWFPLLDQIADEFLIFRPQGGCFFVSRDSVTYRLVESDTRGVMFMQLEINRLKVVPPRQVDRLQAYSLP
ncbi:MAG TPA: hypothetical protein VF865_15865 [Acidobacteriaceae bacterium]